jgi:hypothetical protein
VLRRALTLIPALCILAVGACASNPTERQPGLTSPSPRIGCLDTLHASDTAEAIIAMTVAAVDTNARLPAGFAQLFADEFRMRFKSPPKLSLSVVMGSEPCDSLGSRCAGGELSLASTVYVTAYNNGKLSDPFVVDATLTEALADSIRSALEAISRQEEAPWLGTTDSISLVLALAPEADSDTVIAGGRIFRARLPRYDLPFAAAVMPATGVAAKFPLNASLAGVGDTVTLAFTVHPDGSIAPESVDVVRARYRDFVASVLDALGSTRYHPAHLGDCAVATRIRQRFIFRSP